MVVLPFPLMLCCSFSSQPQKINHMVAWTMKGYRSALLSPPLWKRCLPLETVYRATFNQLCSSVTSVSPTVWSSIGCNHSVREETKWCWGRKQIVLAKALQICVGITSKPELVIIALTPSSAHQRKGQSCLSISMQSRAPALLPSSE